MFMLEKAVAFFIRCERFFPVLRIAACVAVGVVGEKP